MFYGNPASGAPQGGGGDVVSDIKNWFVACGFFTKHLIYAIVGIYVISFIINIDALLVNQPLYVVSGVQIWRLITSPLVTGGILQLAFGFFAYLPTCGRLEKEWGTIKTFVDFVIKNLLVNILFVMICYLFGLLFPMFKLLPCYGLWQIFFVQLVGKCLENPEGVSMLLCLPVQIKTKYYPVALFLLFSIISGRPTFDNLAAILYGYLHYKFLDTKYQAFLSSTRMSAWENSAIFAWLKDQTNYVDPSGATHNGAQLNDLERAAENLPGQAPPAANFNAFGGRGVSIGETEEPKTKKKNEYFQLEDDISGDLGGTADR